MQTEHWHEPFPTCPTHIPVSSCLSPLPSSQLTPSLALPNLVCRFSVFFISCSACVAIVCLCRVLYSWLCHPPSSLTLLSVFSTDLVPLAVPFASFPFSWDFIRWLLLSLVPLPRERHPVRGRVLARARQPSVAGLFVFRPRDQPPC